jgi:hypothetical protein
MHKYDEVCTGNETNSTNASRPLPVARFTNATYFTFQLVPNGTVNATFTSECSKLVVRVTFAISYY